MFIKSTIRRVANWAGYEIRRIKPEAAPQDGIAVDPRVGDAIKLVQGYTMLSNARLTTLYQQVKHLDANGRAGALVECGTWKGGAVGVMALANRNGGARPRHLHLFDAFDDIHEPDPAVDGPRILAEVRDVLGIHDPKGRVQAMKGAYDTVGGHGTIEEARTLLERTIGYDPAYIHFHKGWFQDTVPVDAKAIGDIALLRLDGDLYVSIKVCLEHLYDQVVPGGFVVIDDYGYYDGCTRAVDEFIASRGLDAFLCPADHVPRFHVFWTKR